jgi:TP901 family phage tail tape measure protein
MEKSLSLGVLIGATMSGGFATTIGKARGHLTTLGDSIKQLSRERGLIERFEEDQAALEKARLKLGATQREVSQLKAALRKDPSDEGTARALERTQTRAVKLGEALERQREQLRKSRQAMEKAGISVGDYARQYTRLGEALEKTQARHAKLQAAIAKRDAAKKQLMNLRGGLLGFAGAAYGLGHLIGSEAGFESAGIRLSTVANAKDVGEAVAKSRRHALAFARKSLSSETEVLDIEYALNSAGLDAQTSRLGSEVVAKVAKVTDGASEQVGEVVATVFNNLGRSLEGNSIQRLERVGELLTKTQFKFQIRDFGQLGESMKEASPALSQYNVNLEQGVTLIGALNSAGLQGGRAGTSLSASFRQLSKASKEFDFDIAHDSKGGLDFIATLQNLSDAIGGFNDLDQDTNDRLQKAFGDEGLRAVILLGKQMDKLRAAQEDVAKGSKGIVDENYKKFLEGSEGKIKRFWENIHLIGMAFAGTLLPAVNAVLDPLTQFAGWVGTLIEDHPGIGRFIAGIALGLGLLAAKIGVVTGASWLWNTALVAVRTAVTTNPVGALISALVIGAGLVITYWKPIEEFFGKLWEVISSIGSAISGMGIGADFGSASEVEAAMAGAAPHRTLALAGTGNTTMVNAPITVHAAQGMNAEDVANAVDRKLRERESLAQARQRGALYDGEDFD